jgi:hypothetical protein
MEAWNFLAGLGLFIYGMRLMEFVQIDVAGRSIMIYLFIKN